MNPKKSKAGRKKGYKKSEAEMLNSYSEIVVLLKKGKSVREIMKETDRSNGTVMKIKKIIAKSAIKKRKGEASEMNIKKLQEYLSEDENWEKID